MDNKVISLYIHIPFCVSKCSYCDFFSIPTGQCKNAVPYEYVNALCNEIPYRIKEAGSTKLKTVYIGGGTPSLLSTDQINKICDVIKACGLAPEYEFTFEINPDDASEELLTSLNKNGVNRISCGVQSFSDDVLKCVHRRADSKQNYDCFSVLKDMWKEKLSVDLICGLPGETEESLLKGLDFLIKNNVPHISFYSLCVEEETPLGKSILSNTLEYDQDFSDELWLKGRDLLLANGYLQYEVSNFCKSGFECMHNMTYWKHQDYIACGSGGTGTLYNMELYGTKLAQKGEGVRYTNTKDINEYTSFWSNQALQQPADTQNIQNPSKIPQYVEKIEHQTSQFEYFMMGLRTLRGISPAEYKELFGQEIPEETLEKLKSHCKINEKGFYYLEKEQLLFLNNLLETLI